MVQRIERRLELPREIVWEALVDPVLAEGWLHPDARLAEASVVTLWDEPAAIESDSPALGHVRISLADLPGGSRDRSTGLAIELLDVPERERPAAFAMWSTRVDQLGTLLRGHPVDWDHWERDRRSDYDAYLAEAVAAAS
ncbi:MAG: hypothetical protein HY996_01535 [Micrococcales bacterium]|nr:hypothetical protein [Micrococcales bacterium]